MVDAFDLPCSCRLRLVIARRRRPCDRLIERVEIKTADLSLDEMLGDARRQTRKPRVGRQRNLCNPAMMVANEPDMPQESGEILPARELACVYYQPLQLPVLADPLIDRVCQRIEVFRPQRTRDFEHHDSTIREQAVP